MEGEPVETILMEVCRYFGLPCETAAQAREYLGGNLSEQAAIDARDLVIYLLYVYAGLEQKEIGQLLGRSRGNISLRLRLVTDALADHDHALAWAATAIERRVHVGIVGGTGGARSVKGARLAARARAGLGSRLSGAQVYS